MTSKVSSLKLLRYYCTEITSLISYKRKEIDFTMADLERDAEEDDDEYKAKIKDVGEKSLPSRKCKNTTL